MNIYSWRYFFLKNLIFNLLVADDSIEMCDPWDTIEFVNNMKNTPDENCEHCLPDCEITVYEIAVSSAPFESCDHTNLETSSMCSLTSGYEFNPPIWMSDTKEQFIGILVNN